MTQINIGLVKQGTKSSLVLTHFQGELYQQVIIDKRIDNETSHILQRSLLGAGYRKLPSLVSRQRQRCPWLTLETAPQTEYQVPTFSSRACQTLKFSETFSQFYYFIFVNSLEQTNKKKYILIVHSYFSTVS